MNTMQTNEIVSALADGHLRDEELAHALSLCAADPAATRAWQAYHLIGDVLRSSELAACSAPDAFMARLSRQLAAEAPFATEKVATHAQLAGAAAVFDVKPAANDSLLRWKMVAGFASLAAVAAVGWTVMSAVGTPSQQAELAAAQPQAAGIVLAGSQNGPMIRDARVDELMAAHRQLGGANALQAPAGFLRNATFEGPQR